MSDIKLSQLPEVSSLSPSDILPNVASGVTSKITLQNLASSMPEVSSSISASYAATASFLLGSIENAVTASYAFTASYIATASWARYSTTASYVITAQTASYVKNAQTSSFVTASNVYGPFGSNSIISASYALTASYAPNTNSFPYSGSAQITGSLGLTGSLFFTDGTKNLLIRANSNYSVNTGTSIVATLATASYDSAFFDYVVKDGTNYRAGIVVAVWSPTTYSFSDTSTTDIGNTSGVVFGLDLDTSGTARLRATVNSNNWIIKTMVRAL